MLTVSRYALQYSGVSAAAVAAKRYDLFITEAAPIAGSPQLSDAQVASLGAAGTRVIGYVDVAVTDDARPYWNSAWTSDGTDRGTIDTADAPAWLDTGVGVNFDGVAGDDGYIVDFTDLAWQQIVIDQAVNLVSRGYDGVFLDDVGAYFSRGLNTGGTTEIVRLAGAMMDFVVRIDMAIRAVDPAAVIVVNGNPYIVTDANGGIGSASSQAFLGAVDAMLLESAFGIAAGYDSNAIAVARANIAPHAALLALESGGVASQNAIFASEARALGITPFASSGSGYTSLDAPSAAPTEARDLIVGTRGANIIRALGGNDLVQSLDGDDVVFGAAGDDAIQGGAGADRLYGDAGIDTLSGDDGDDRLYGGGDRDVLRGGAGDDMATGEGGNDLIYGGAGRDTLTGGAGADIHYFDDGEFAGLTAASADRIVDFNRGEGDRISLAAVDANGLTPAEDRFTFIGAGAFTGVAGQLRCQIAGSVTLVTGDTDGNGVADFMIRLDGQLVLQSGDFVL